MAELKIARNILSLLKEADPAHLIISESEAAQLADISLRGMQHLRYTGRSAPYLRIGDRVKYRALDVLEWLEQRAVAV